MAHPIPHDIAWFESPAELREWLETNHATAAELWVGMRPKASGLPTLGWEAIVDEVLCAGWIDSVRYKVDGGACIRITPRRPRSIWSARNVGRIEVLRAAGRMLPSGEAAFAQRRVDRTAVYSFEGDDQLDADGVEALRSAGGLEFFERQPRTYRRSAASWIRQAKRPETRTKRLTILATASAAGERAAELTSAGGRRKAQDPPGTSRPGGTG